MLTKQIRVQIVDDHLLLREGLAAILRQEPDIEVVSLAGTVSEAVEYALATHPEIVFMDDCLPDGSGVEATRQIIANYPECKIIFLTALEQEDCLVEAIRAGAKGYLLKSISAAKLLSALRSVHDGEPVLSSSVTRLIMEKFACFGSGKSQPKSDLDQLTPREVDVLRVLTTEKTNQEIANNLYISENTVRYHVHSILNKLHLASRNEAARYARQRGLSV